MARWGRAPERVRAQHYGAERQEGGEAKAERDADALAECDRLALERFRMLDAMEAEDERRQNSSR